VRLRLARGDDALEGVLQMKAPALMNGYHKLPELTREVMTEDGYYITGDIFRRDEYGFHYFVGRVDDMFVSGGENIYPSEVERMLERHPAVEQASVIGVADEKWGEVGKAIIRVVSDAEAAGYTIIDRYVERGIPIFTGAAVNYTLDGCIAVITLNK